MQFKSKASSTILLPDVEHNSGEVMIRGPATVSTKESEGRVETIYTYDMYIMSENEYVDVQIGRFAGPWTDLLRGVQRAYLYDEADKMVSKYSTDVSDDAKKQAWIAYKAGVRATQNAQGYPQTVSYPTKPE